ncbi:hypothetical protein ACFXPW_19650, partial [Streptomyces goshikiensis]|uniref:hypothetical protein n=1 Tax=Streptomyces goshikiensis TaxID=1942 RepID=UPI003697A1C2
MGELVTHLGTSDGFWTWRYKVDTAWKRRAQALLKAGGADELVRYAVREPARGGSFHDVNDPERAIRELGTRPVSRARSLAIGFLLWWNASVDAVITLHGPQATTAGFGRHGNATPVRDKGISLASGTLCFSPHASGLTSRSTRPISRGCPLPPPGPAGRDRLTTPTTPPAPARAREPQTQKET